MPVQPSEAESDALEIHSKLRSAAIPASRAAIKGSSVAGGFNLASTPTAFAALARVKANPPWGPVPMVTGKPLAGVRAEEEKHNRESLDWMRRNLRA